MGTFVRHGHGKNNEKKTYPSFWSIFGQNLWFFWSKDVVVTPHQRFVFTPNLSLGNILTVEIDCDRQNAEKCSKNAFVSLCMRNSGQKCQKNDFGKMQHAIVPHHSPQIECKCTKTHQSDVKKARKHDPGLRTWIAPEKWNKQNDFRKSWHFGLKIMNWIRASRYFQNSDTLKLRNDANMCWEAIPVVKNYNNAVSLKNKSIESWKFWILNSNVSSFW